MERFHPNACRACASRSSERSIIAARSLSLEPQTSAFLDWLEALEKAGALILSVGMQDRGWADCGRDSDDRVAQEAALLNSYVREMRTYAYFADTVLRFFDDLGRERLERSVESGPPYGAWDPDAGIRIIARARSTDINVATGTGAAGLGIWSGRRSRRSALRPLGRGGAVPHRLAASRCSTTSGAISECSR
jgi:hypothetical protein